MGAADCEYILLFNSEWSGSHNHQVGSIMRAWIFIGGLGVDNSEGNMGVAIGALFGVFSLSMVAKTAVLAVTHLKVNKYKVITSLIIDCSRICESHLKFSLKF